MEIILREASSLAESAQTPGRVSKYLVIKEALELLKEGEGIEIKTPEGMDQDVYFARIRQYIYRGTVVPPKGCVFRNRRLKTGNIGVSCIRNLREDLDSLL